MSLQLTLLFDPLCGWCYGAHPALTAVDAALAPDWTLLPTGLFAHPQAMTAERARFFWQNDRRIASLTGQIFSPAYRSQILDDLNEPFDASLATLAWQWITHDKTELGLTALQGLQALRYEHGLHYRIDTLTRFATGFGLEAERFRQQLASGPTPPLLAVRQQALALMQQHRLQGVPALLVRHGDAMLPVDGRLLYDPSALVASLARMTH
ncbi:hypothetical protein [Chitinimonas naiadis]